MQVVIKKGFYHCGKTYKVGDVEEFPRPTAIDLINAKLVQEYAPLPPSVIVCMASGPSLTLKQVALIKKWREATTDEKRHIIAVNNTYERAPWADFLLAGDKEWWKNYDPNFEGKKYSIQETGIKGVEVAPIKIKTANKVKNSGGSAMLLAKALGAVKIILVGYDLKIGRFGKRHWHKDHPRPLANASKIEDWPARFESIKDEFKGIDVVNCSTDTALTIYRMNDLESELLC